MATIPLELPSVDLYYDFSKKTVFYISCERNLFCVHVEEDNLCLPSLVPGESSEVKVSSDPLRVTSSSVTGYEDLLSVDGSTEDDALYVGSSSGTIFQVDKSSGRTVSQWTVNNSKDDAVVLKALRNMLVVGYDSGRVRLWDNRQTKKPVYSYRGHGDSVTDIIVREPKDTLDVNTVLSSGGEGTISVFELRSSSTPIVTESVRDEITCLGLIKNGSVVVGGTLEGDLIMFEWRLWDKLLDNCKGHPEAIGDMCSVDNDTLLTGSDDGLLRLVNIHPNQIIGVVGVPFELPIEKLILEPVSKTLICSSYESFVRCFDASCLYEQDSSTDIMKETIDTSVKDKKRKSFLGKRRKATFGNETISSFFDDLSN
ncbi:WD repeat-containing protein 55 [Galdieria sulphuraria]|uniref:Transducin family protein / WD-40 repeat family protein n=1 Tax=Galdieria sulphuraria TaxID=130081 RepID=M2Y2M0_GALSU|nr:transducin family protein / WD-40 repeat family protein [Galdieria sulphuraria]EME30064.1 transducin family protein / WD-40 repeat family protein [Galdieria sulphuraria]GJD06878.1 WD repeat-containing protein 55 [Galdieria sulphuraria]|eukprot:XP_005706584.1 transducin family protein / WD-40 repeat family protein [Galdieria sulphuraria]